MRDTDLFQMALGLIPPWLVATSEFSAAAHRLDLHIDFARGGRFACPDCKAPDCPVHDTEEKTWRHLDFFQHQAYLHARVPRVRCPTHGVRQVDVPWARPGSGFTLLFEALIMAMAPHMTMRAISDRVGEHDTRLWRIVMHYTDAGRAREDMRGVRHVGVDETASRRGQSYVSVFADLDRAKVLFATPGRDADTVGRFAGDLRAHGGDPASVSEVACDMGAGFLKGASEHLPDAQLTLDKFHVTKLVVDALDEVRRSEQHEAGWKQAVLKRTRYAWLTNEHNQSARHEQIVEALSLPQLNLKTAKAYRMKLTFQQAYARTGKAGERGLEKWCRWAVRCGLAPMKRAATTIRQHWEGVVRYFRTGLTTAVMEGINSRIQAAKAKARGYRSDRYFIAVIYLLAGKLDLQTHSR